MTPDYRFQCSDLAPLAGGAFLMGQAHGRDEERPVHEVSLDPFWLCRYQVTNADFDAFCRATGRPLARFRQQPAFCHPGQPVVGVNWFDALAYCQWLAASTALCIRLPTEAEWEYAARGGLSQKLFPWGDAPCTAREGYHTRWKDGPEVVGTSQPNGFGLFDMGENVHEWCADWYDPAYYSASPLRNPRGPESGARRASRGGAWRHHIKIARCAARSSLPPAFEYADYGFRVAASPSG